MSMLIKDTILIQLDKKEIFTEYDENLQKTLNIDPMGLQVVWTFFGQKIFQNKLTSVALDIRSYNINIFNHFIIKNLMSHGTEEIKNMFIKEEKETIEKLLIILENMLIWSWYCDQNNWDKSGLLGTSKALKSWDEKKINLNLKSDIETLELLKRQKQLGVNGRYKGPFIEMNFFKSSHYSEYLEDEYNNIFSLIENNQALKNLYLLVMEFFHDENRDEAAIPTDEYTQVFSNVSVLADDTKDFWLSHLGFINSEAKVIYDIVDLQNYKQNNKDIFIQANSQKKSEIFKTIIDLESKLAYVDKLFTYLLLCDNKEVQEINNNYFNTISSFNFDSIDAKDSAKIRLYELSKIKDVATLIHYHKEIMISRGHVPWVSVVNGKVKVDITKNGNIDTVLKILDEGVDNIDWIHDYYIWSVRSIKKGLEK